MLFSLDNGWACDQSNLCQQLTGDTTPPSGDPPMLTVLGARQRFCDGLTRRNFLRIGGLAVGGLTLPDLLRHEARAGTRSSHKSVIMVFLPGGPPHQDMVDLKPDAPSEVRGEFKPVATRVPGIQICEHLPLLAER